MLNDSGCSAGMEVNLSLQQRSIPVTITFFHNITLKIIIPTITALHLKKKYTCLFLIKVCDTLGDTVISSAVPLKS